MELFLTGSHFFGTAKNGSDIDYVGLDNAANRILLLRCGFEQTSNWRFKSGRMDIRLIPHLDIHLAAQRRISEKRLAKELENKQQAAQIWKENYERRQI